MVLSSLGYQGSNPDEFFPVLKDNNIKILVDVRENPVSRKKGFSKNTLKKASEENGIKYIHFSSLGSKRDIRKEYRSNNNWAWFSEQYKKYLVSQTDEIMKLSELIFENNCCLMCFETDYKLCHRSLLIDHLLKDLDESINIKHLIVAEKAVPA